ncbi:hypothetical protein GCM10007989_38730 [Devosia pacifica]|uniref:Xylose isomerase-like TIM barrel domain-containing protein n=1 Tax=Devosia pacifica TaxID=1335967 RepID=A0A918VZA4_9HYPH|nr:sugar phosphate isomerase/epimerase family protein [Devosia pacifica]GHA39280.1 hypothetical protein GCM10007989_38730 [Devosia pacifica]
MAVRLAYHANCWGPLGGNAVGVTSIAQLTYRTFGDMERAIAAIGDAGYEGVELFDGNLLDYEGRYDDLRAALDRAGLSLVAVYSGANFIFDDILAEELERIERVARAAAMLDAEHLVVGGGAQRVLGQRPDDMQKLGAALDRVADIADGSGLKGHYHPHLSTMIEGPDSVREIFRHTRIDFCPDTAHLAGAGGDPSVLVADLHNRISYVHLKGLQRDPFAFAPLDTGDLDNAAVIEVLKANSFDGWITTELDAWPDPEEGARRSYRYLAERL